MKFMKGSLENLTGNVIVYARLEGTLQDECFGCQRCDFSKNTVAIIGSENIGFLKSKVDIAFRLGLVNQKYRDEMFKKQQGFSHDAAIIYMSKKQLYENFSDMDIVYAGTHYCPEECEEIATSAIMAYYTIFDEQDKRFFKPQGVAAKIMNIGLN